MLDNIEFASLGQVGDTLHAVILHTPKENDGTRYMMGPNDIELYTYISEVMPKLVNKNYLRFCIICDTYAIISHFVAVKRILRENGILYT